MRNPRQSEIAVLALGLGIAAGGIGGQCDAVPLKQSQRPCAPNVAEIMIWDGKIQKLCGCGGVDGEFAAANTPLTCTFAVGTTAFIYYQGPFLRHQFVHTGTPALDDGPVFDPNSNQPIRAHSVKPTAAGTYSFKDEFDQTITGVITVTP